jgi:hypothetical protein
VKAEVPAHAQRMDSLLAADREFVFCRESKGGRVLLGGRGAGREAREGLWVVARRKWVCTRGRSESRLEGQGMRGAHGEHVDHANDLGGVPAQRLVEGARVLPAEREGHAMRDEVRAGRREGVGWWWRERRARGQGPSQGLGGRARAERTVNMLAMYVTLDVSKLSGWLNFCTPCQPKGGACDMGRGVFCRESKGGLVRCGGRGAGREAGGPVGSGAAQVGMYTGKVRVKAWGPGHARSAR